MRAIWNGATIAHSDHTVLVEGNHYFPPGSVDRGFVKDSPTTSVCPWKGKASYLDVVVDGKVNAGAAWFYPDPKAEARHIAGHVAFWRGVDVVA